MAAELWRARGELPPAPLLPWHWGERRLGTAPDTGSESCSPLGQLWWLVEYEFSLFACFHKVCRNPVLLESLSRPGMGLESAKRPKALHVHGSCLRFLTKPDENFPWALPGRQSDWPGKPQRFPQTLTVLRRKSPYAYPEPAPWQLCWATGALGWVGNGPGMK